MNTVEKNYYLKFARVKAKYTQLGLAKDMGLTQTKLSHFETGYLLPTKAERRKLAGLLGDKKILTTIRTRD